MEIKTNLMPRPVIAKLHRRSFIEKNLNPQEKLDNFRKDHGQADSQLLLSKSRCWKSVEQLQSQLRMLFHLEFCTQLNLLIQE